mgnify:CR=1 FL=1
MIVLASSAPLPNLRRVRREIETRRLEQIKKAHADIKKIASDEMKFFKDLFEKEVEEGVKKTDEN